MWFSGFVNPCWSCSKATVESGLLEDGILILRGAHPPPFALGTLVTAKLLPFRVGRLEAHTAG